MSVTFNALVAPSSFEAASQVPIGLTSKGIVAYAHGALISLNPGATEFEPISEGLEHSFRLYREFALIVPNESSLPEQDRTLKWCRIEALLSPSPQTP